MIQECCKKEKLDIGHFGFKAFIALLLTFQIYLFTYFEHIFKI